jgi:hypothetical protein
VWASVWASVRDSVRDSVRASVRDSVWDSVWDSVGDSVGDSVYGQHDANWLAFYRYFHDVCDLKTQTEKLQGLWRLSQSAGWAIPHQNICWVSERHQLLARNAQGRLHSVAGPAVLFPDGWAIYAINGTRVPAEWVEKRGELDPRTALTWKNIEQRRAAAELIGWDRVLSVLNPTVIDTNKDPQIGTLMRVDLPDSPGEQVLKVRCGTQRDFVLPVPPTVHTALEANAWTFGLDANELRLEVRT